MVAGGFVLEHRTVQEAERKPSNEIMGKEGDSSTHTEVSSDDPEQRASGFFCLFGFFAIFSLRYSGLT